MQLSSSASSPVQEKKENGCIGPGTTSNEAVVAPNSDNYKIQIIMPATAL